MTNSTETFTNEEAIDLALSHHRAGRLDEAEGIYRRVLQSSPAHPTATRMLGVVASQRGRHEDAIALLNHAVSLSQNDAAVAMDLAVACRAANRMHEAESAYRIAVSFSPPVPAALAAYGQFLRQAGRPDEAIPFFARAAELDPTQGALTQLGIALAERQRLDEAAAAFRRCIEIDPQLATAYNNLGTTLLRQRRPQEAEQCFRDALRLDPDNPQLLDHLASALTCQNRPREAVVYLERAVTLGPDLAHAHENLSWALLALGDWSRGFTEYAWRAKSTQQALNRLGITQPLWEGGDLKGKSILLHAEGGLGDAIHFVRYAPLVAQRGGVVSLLCAKTLVRLFRGVRGVERVLAIEEQKPSVDLQCPLLSLPHIFGTTIENVPFSNTPYLSAIPDDVHNWERRLGPKPPLRVGLVWAAGNPTNAMLAMRSLSLATLAPLAGVAGVQFYSVQKGPAATELANPPAGLNVFDFTPELQDMADTAAFLKNMDLVITPDTAVAHLAGALGRPTVVMLPFAADWRWMLDRADTPWYASVRLFRQKTPGNWTDVVERVARSLKEWAAKKNP